MYNAIIASINNVEVKDIVQEIVNQEIKNVGKLQSALEIISPNVELIDAQDEL